MEITVALFVCQCFDVHFNNRPTNGALSEKVAPLQYSVETVIHWGLHGPRTKVNTPYHQSEIPGELSMFRPFFMQISKHSNRKWDEKWRFCANLARHIG